MTVASQQTQVQSAHTPSASATTDPSSSSEELAWEGDRMFNIYIWDYCVKRGYSNTARELAEEAKLNPNPRPPIDAKQGLLYEWWSVFWVLFSAKSNNQGPDDAMVYMQNHMQHRLQHQVQGAMQRYPNGLRALPTGPVGMPTVPNSLGAGAPQHPSHPNQPPNAHSMPNGIGPTPPGQQQAGQPQGQGPLPQQQAPCQQPPQAPPPLGFPAHVQQQPPQPNGVPAHGRPPMAGQAPPAPGAGHPGRPQLPFYQQSPTMAHQQAGGAAGPPPPYPGPMGTASMPQNMYPQPHMRGMFPPGAPNGIGAGGAAGSPGFSQGNVGAGSRAPTPGHPTGSSITQPSPSMTHRSVPATPPNFGGPSGMAVPGGRAPMFDQLNTDIQKIDAAMMNELRQELGLGNKDPAAMTPDEKSRLVNAFRQRNAPGPSNPARAQQGRGSKRNSVSPGDEHAEIPAKNETSPPAQKRARRSPEQPAPPTQGPAGSAPPGGPSNTNQNPPGGMYPPNMMQNGMRPPFTPQMAPMGMGQAAPPGMMMPPGAHQGMVNQQMQFQKNPSQAYHANLQATHKMGAAGMPMSPSIPVSNTGDNVSHTSSDPQQAMQQLQFGGDPNQGRPAPPSFGGAPRPGVNQGKMLPPSSPATSVNTNGQGKQPQNVQGKTETGGKVDTSPRNAPPPPPTASTGPSPATPAPAQGGPSVPSPSLNNQSRPSTSTSNPPGTTSGPAPPVAAPPAPAPPVSTSSAPTETVNFDFMSANFDDFTFMFGRDEQQNLELDFFNTSDFSGLPDLGR